MISRREFLWTGAAPLLKLKRAPRRILLRLRGGPSHIDTFDPKPDASSEIRGPFRTIRTNVPGIEISEIFPRLARHADKFSLYRSVFHSGASDHETGLNLLPADDSETVIVDIGGEQSWDAHCWGPFPSLASYRDGAGAAFDMACSSLVEQLHNDDRLKSTLILATGEFGRTPRLNPQGGRDHWPHCWTALVAGGGIEGGQVIGSSDRIGAEPRDNPVSIQELVRKLGFAV